MLVEPGTCPANYTAEQIATLAKMPILVVFGDYRDTPTGMPSLPTGRPVSRPVRPDCRSGGWRAGADAQPGRDRRRGNSHMIMQDKNNLQVADLILKWLASASASRAARRNDPPRAASGIDRLGPCC